jgi:hypothetical protein
MKKLLVLLLLAGVAGATELRTAAPEGVKEYFISPRNGEIVGQTFTVRFGLSGMGIAPAGTEAPNSGHHHLLIDVSELPPLDQPLPTSDSIRHFGKGQTETELTLPPGMHTLQLILGNHLHIPFDPPVLSEKITIRVE